jgi:hypothetical protein
MSPNGIPKEKQGTALGIFGAGNVGAAVTKFCRAVRHGGLWLADVAQIWAAAWRHRGPFLVHDQGRSGTASAARSGRSRKRLARCWSR